MRRPKLTYANVMSTLAVFIALGGVSYAAVKLPKNSVGPAQIKKNAVTGSKVKNSSLAGSDVKNSSLTGSDVKDGSLTGKDFNGSVQGAQGPQGAQGAQGAKGDPGSSAVRLFASVAIDGKLGKNSGATAAAKDTAFAPFGFYLVTFNADITNCVYVATVGSDALSVVPSMLSTTRVGTSSVQVRSEDKNGDPADRPFYLAVHC